MKTAYLVGMSVICAAGAVALAGILGDANSDGKVDFADQTAVLANFGSDGPPDLQSLYIEVDQVVYGTDPALPPRITKRLIEADAISSVEADYLDPMRSVLLVGPYRSLVTIQMPYSTASMAMSKLMGRSVVRLEGFVPVPNE